MPKTLVIIFVFSILCPLSLIGSGGIAAVPCAYLGDAASAAVYRYSGGQAGSVLELYMKGKNRSYLSLTPIVIEGDDASVPTRRVSAGIVSENEAVCSFEKGSERVRFAHGAAAYVSADLTYIQDGVYAWQMTLTNGSANTRSFQLGLVMHTGTAEKVASFRADDAQLLMLVADQAAALGAVSAYPLAYDSALKGAPLALLSSRERQGDFSFTAHFSLEALSQASVSFILSFDSNTGAAGKKCSQWMRLAGSGDLEKTKENLWRDWLALGRMPDLSDTALRQSLFRALRSLDTALHHSAFMPAEAEALLDCAEATRAFGRDASAAQYMSGVSAFLAARRKTLAAFAESADGREVLMRYASLASRLTITSGKLAGDLDLVRQALDTLRAAAASGAENVSPAGAALSSGGKAQAAQEPSEAVRLTAAFSDGALLARLSRDEKNAVQFENNALAFQKRQNSLYSEEALAWTDARGIPDVRVFTAGVYLQSEDARFARQYVSMRPFAFALSPRERVLFLSAAAESFDRRYFQSTLLANTEGLAAYHPTQAMALWLKAIGDGVLYACLDERDPYSDYRLESLYRTLLEIRHTSRHAAASFIFRDLRARIREKLDTPRERDDAFVGSLALDYGKLRVELDRYALASPLERSLTLSRLDQIERGILAMIFARQKQYPSFRCTAEENGLRISIPENSLLGALPARWRVGTSELRGGMKDILLIPAAASAENASPEYVIVDHRVQSGGQELKWSEHILLSHPKPIVTYSVPYDPLRGKFILHNRSWRAMDIMSVQSTHPIIKSEIYSRIGAQSALALDMDMAPELQRQPVRFIVVVEGHEVIHRLEPKLSLSASIPFHAFWERFPKGEILDLDALAAALDDPEYTEGAPGRPVLSLPQEEEVRLAKTFTTPDIRGQRLFGVRADSILWTAFTDRSSGRELIPVLRDGWYWYDFGFENSLRLTLTFPSHEALYLFAQSPKRLIIGQER